MNGILGIQLMGHCKDLLDLFLIRKSIFMPFQSIRITEMNRDEGHTLRKTATLLMQ